jgi:ABC-type multidrug transport system fused ATPase/permease subunit
MRGRTIVLVSHHVRLCASGASYIVALDNGRLQFQGDRESFQNSDVMRSLVQSTNAGDGKDEVEEILEGEQNSTEFNLDSESSSAAILSQSSDVVKIEKRPPRKLVEEEKRAVGLVARNIWETYIQACGNGWYWTLFLTVLLVASITPVFENGWMRHVIYPLSGLQFTQHNYNARYWASTSLNDNRKSPSFYVAIYAAITTAGLVISTLRFFILYNGSIRASGVLYERMLETVLFAKIRFHDTVSRGRVLNRFGKDFEGGFIVCVICYPP